MVKKSADGGASSSVAPFLRKCYEMVDDSSTDSIISWSKTVDNSFVIYDTTVFSVQLLPKFFKHSNFSSFIRQLNIYGFRKVDADRWEFANDRFVRGQKELLKNVIRRKNVQSSDQNKSVPRQETSTSDSQENTENSELWKEVDILKGDKHVLAQELIKVRQYQESTDTKMLNLKDRVQGMEESQQEMLSFLVMVIQNPNLLVQLLQPKENNCWRMAAEGGGGGAKIVEEVTDEGETNSTSSARLPLVTYQPQSEGTGKTSLSDVNDFLRNADMMKFCMDENHVPLIIPDLYDDGAWEKLLLLSPSKKKKKKKNNVKKGNSDRDDEAVLEEDDGRMETENKSRMLELIEEEMEKIDDFEFGQLTPERSRNLEILTEQMGLLASNE